jgi:hypothetical protein
VRRSLCQLLRIGLILSWLPISGSKSLPISLVDVATYPWRRRFVTRCVATQGFGAEVLAAFERRRQALRELGIAPDDPLPV